MIVACLGSSTTAGKGQAYDWVGELAQKLRQKNVTFRNFGVGGDLAGTAVRSERLGEPILQKFSPRPRLIVGRV